MKKIKVYYSYIYFEHNNQINNNDESIEYNF